MSRLILINRCASVLVLLSLGCNKASDTKPSSPAVRTPVEQAVAFRGLQFRTGVFVVKLDSAWRCPSAGNTDRLGLRLLITNTRTEAQTYTPGLLTTEFNGSAVQLHSDDSVRLIPLEDAHQADFSFMIPRKLMSRIYWMPTPNTTVLLDTLLARHQWPFMEFAGYFKRALAENDTLFLNSCLPPVVQPSKRKDEIEEIMLSKGLPEARERVVRRIRPHGQWYNAYVDSAAQSFDISDADNCVRLYFKRSGTSYVLFGAKYYNSPMGE